MSRTRLPYIEAASRTARPKPQSLELISRIRGSRISDVWEVSVEEVSMYRAKHRIDPTNLQFPFYSLHCVNSSIVERLESEELCRVGTHRPLSSSFLGLS